MYSILIIRYSVRALMPVFMILLCMVTVQAGTYYVSPTGSATWTSATNISTPCSVSTAFANARSGDIVLFRGGTYSVPAKNTSDTYHGYYEPANSGTGDADVNRIIFKAYTGEIPLFNGTAGGTGDSRYYATIFGTNGKDYITFDGFTFQSDSGTKLPRIYIGHDDSVDLSVGVKVKNCIFNGGSNLTNAQPAGENLEAIRIEHADNTNIQGCIIYSIQDQTNNENVSGIKIYFSTNVAIKNCEIYDCRRGIYVKNNVHTVDISYNYVHNCIDGIYANPDGGADIMPNMSIYQNLVTRCNNSIQIYAVATNTVDNLSIYNNTIYSSSTSGTYGIYVGGVCQQVSNNVVIYNNIVQGSQYKLVIPPSVISEIDYNQYGSSGPFLIKSRYYCPTIDYTTLDSWKASSIVSGSQHPDLNGLASDPLFVNTSGRLITIADFALQSTSPSKGTGKGGVDMGANISRVGPTEKVIFAPTNLHILD